MRGRFCTRRWDASSLPQPAPRWLRATIGLLLAAALAGLGNSPFHPVDFTILNHRVSPPRLGHAFAVHGITGNLGWAIAPLVLLGVTEVTGSWRWALTVCALWALAVLALIRWQRDADR